jgi:hypothetical protein
MRVETVDTEGDGRLVLGLVGTRTQIFRRVLISVQELDGLRIYPAEFTFQGDGDLLRLGLQAYALGIAYEYDPYFGLSISRVDPLPHQLEAVYEFLLKVPRVRFLLADDAGAGKTIMAGLLLRELKLRGLIERTLIVCPANLTFQWQREMRDKFDENFDEHLDQFCQGRIVGHIFPQYVGPFPGEPEVPTHFFRAYYADQAVFEVLGQRYSMQPIVDEIAALHERLRACVEGGGRIPRNPDPL